MSDPAWFKLLVRVVGLLLVGLAVPSLVDRVGTVVNEFTSPTPPTSLSVGWVVAWVLGPALQCAFGVYLLAGGGALTRWCVGKAKGRCPSCDYDLRGITGGRCPECGALAPTEPSRKNAGENTPSVGQE